jgi:hypothetical protein
MTIDQIGEVAAFSHGWDRPRRPPWWAEPELATLIHAQFSAAGWIEAATMIRLQRTPLAPRWQAASAGAYPDRSSTW